MNESPTKHLARDTGEQLSPDKWKMEETLLSTFINTFLKILKNNNQYQIHCPIQIPSLQFYQADLLVEGFSNEDLEIPVWDPDPKYPDPYYKYYHFFALTLGLGCGMALYRPYRSLVVPVVLAVIFSIVFEIVGISLGLPAHTTKCKGPPYDKRDIYWGFTFAVLVAILNSNVYHVYTLSYGCGMVMFALRGAKRKYSSLWELRERQQRWW